MLLPRGNMPWTSCCAMSHTLHSGPSPELAPSDQRCRSLWKKQLSKSVGESHRESLRHCSEPPSQSCTPLLPLAPRYRSSLASCQGSVRSAGHICRGQGDSTAQPLPVPSPLSPQGAQSRCLIAGPGCVLVVLWAVPPHASTSPNAVWEQRPLSTLVTAAISRHLGEGISHGLADSLCQFRDVLLAQALGFYPGKDSDGARPWRETGKARDAVKGTHQEMGLPTSVLHHQLPPHTSLSQEKFKPHEPRAHQQPHTLPTVFLAHHLPEVNFLSLELKKSRYGEITMGKMGTCRRWVRDTDPLGRWDSSSYHAPGFGRSPSPPWILHSRVPVPGGAEPKRL